jgi:hypothetical protein
MLRSIRYLTFTTITVTLCSCSLTSRVLNPFYETPAPEAMLGSPNDHALNEEEGGSGSGGKGDAARAALEQMATYRRAQAPEPTNPVIQPAVVRLMWIPDHLNKTGDLVPSHYYYLRVLQDRWAVTDAFELEGQLEGKNGNKPSSNLPYITDKK